MKQSLPVEDGAAERWLFHEVAALRRPLLFSFLLTLAAGMLTVIQAKVLASACQLIVIDRTSVSILNQFLPVLMAVVFLRCFLSYFSELFTARAAVRLKQGVRMKIYRRILSKGSTGRLDSTAAHVEVITAGIDSLESYLTRFVPQLLLAATLPLFILFIALPVEWRASLVLLVSAPFIPLLMILVGKGTQSLNNRQWSKLSMLSGRFTDMIQGLPDLKICSAVKREASVIGRSSEEYRHSTMAVLRVAFLSAFTLEFFSTVGTAVVAVITGFRLLSGSLQLADGLFILMVAPEFYLPLRMLGLSYHARMQGVAAAGSILPLLAESAECHGAEDRIIPAGPVSVSYEDVTFRYGRERGGVTSINLELEAGKTTALVGASGSGKSTLAGLLLGISSPEQGRIRANGVDLKELSIKDWQKRIALMPQNPFFFSGSIRENLSLGVSGVSDASLQAALVSADADGFVAGRPEGLDFHLGEAGAGLSGGELRRLAIARLFLRNPDLVILDEPTAGLDPGSEQLVCASLQRLAVGRTVLLISHREDTVSWANLVVSLNDGRVEDRDVNHG